MPDIACLACSPAAEFCLVGRRSGLAIFNLRAGEPIWTASSQTLPGGAHIASFSQDGRLFATVPQHMPVVRVWWRRLASQAGFGVRMLSHPAPVNAFEWRPRKSWSQTLLTTTTSGEAFVWQESGRGEDFAFYMMARLVHSPASAFVWLNHFVGYQGLLWPFSTAARSRKPTRSVWGSLERGHDHGDAFGHDVFEEFESRAGPFPHRTCCMDWICSVDADRRSTRVWSVEGLGEWARRSATVVLAQRFELAAHSELHAAAMADTSTQALFAWCLVPTPPASEANPLPGGDAVYADSSPFKWRALCVCRTSLLHVGFADDGASFKPLPHALGNFACRLSEGHGLVATLSPAFAVSVRRSATLELLGDPVAVPGALDVCVVADDAVAVLEGDGGTRVLRLSDAGAWVLRGSGGSGGGVPIGGYLVARRSSSLDAASAPTPTAARGAMERRASSLDAKEEVNENPLIAFLSAGSALVTVRKLGVAVADPLRPRLDIGTAPLSCACVLGDAQVLLGCESEGAVLALNVKDGALSTALIGAGLQAPVRLLAASATSQLVAIVAGTSSSTVHIAVLGFTRTFASTVQLDGAVTCLAWHSVAPGVNVLACGLMSGACAVLARKAWADWGVLSSAPADLSPSVQLYVLPDCTVLRLTRQHVLSALSGRLRSVSARALRASGLPQAVPHVGCLAVGVQGGLALPFFHPRALFEMMRLNMHGDVGDALARVRRALRRHDGRPGACSVTWLRLWPEDDDDDDEAGDALEALLSTTRIAQLAPKDNLRLLAVSGAHFKVTTGAKQGLDDAGSHFSLALQLYAAQRKTLAPDDRPRALQTSDVAWAVLSEATHALAKLALGDQPTWADARAVGAALWVRDGELCKQVVEKMARAQYTLGNRDPFKCLLFYAALGKCKVVGALFRAAKNVPGNDRLADLLVQDFAVDRWRAVAAKNAYALLAKQRYEEAAAFFVMAGKVADACRVCVRNLGDWQLALMLARTVESEGSAAALKDVVDHTLVMLARATGDCWLLCMARMLQKDAEGSLAALANAVPPLDSGDEALFYASIARCLVPTLYDACEPAFLRERLKQAPFWGRSTAHGGAVKASMERASRYFLQQGMPWIASGLVNASGSLGTDEDDNDDVRTEATLVVCTALALEAASAAAADPMGVSLATAQHAVLAAIAQRCKLTRVGLDDVLARVTGALRSLHQHTALCVLDANAGRAAMETALARAVACRDAAWLASLVPGLRWLGRESMARAASALACMQARRFEAVARALEGDAVGLDDVAAAAEAAAAAAADEPPGAEEEWSAAFARQVLRLLVAEKLCALVGTDEGGAVTDALRALASDCYADVHATKATPGTDLMEASRRLMSGRGLPAGVQALWTQLGGADCMQRFASELAALLPPPRSGETASTASTGAAAQTAAKGKLSSISIYNRPGELLLGVGVSRARPDFVVIAGESGTRDVNVDSSMRFRERTPDGRGLVDADADSWQAVLTRFSGREAVGDEGGGGGSSSTAAGMANNRQRQVGLGQTRHRVSTGGRALAAALGNAPAMRERIGHAEAATCVDAHHVVPFYCAGASDGSVVVYEIGQPYALAKLCRPSAAAAQNWRSAFCTKVRISPDGMKVMGVDSAGQVAFWNFDGGSVQAYAGVACHGSAGRDAVYLNTSTLFASCAATDNEVHVWDLLLPPHARRVASFRIPGDHEQAHGVHALAFAGPRLFAGTGAGGILAFDFRKHAFSHVLVGAHSKTTACLEIDPAGHVLASGSADGSVRLWSIEGGNVASFAQLGKLHQPAMAFNSASSTSLISTHGVTAMTFAADGGTLVTVGADGTAKMTSTSVGGVY